MEAVDPALEVVLEEGGVVTVKQPQDVVFPPENCDLHYFEAVLLYTYTVPKGKG